MLIKVLPRAIRPKAVFCQKSLLPDWVFCICRTVTLGTEQEDVLMASNSWLNLANALDIGQEPYKPDDNSKPSISSADQNGTTQVNGLNEGLEPGNLLHVDHKPRLLLMGLKRCAIASLLPISRFLLIIVRRSGKSSISNVVFRKMAPHETLFLETTTTIRKESMQ